MHDPKNDPIDRDGYRVDRDTGEKYLILGDSVPKGTYKSIGAYNARMYDHRNDPIDGDGYRVDRVTGERYMYHPLGGARVNKSTGDLITSFAKGYLIGMGIFVLLFILWVAGMASG